MWVWLGEEPPLEFDASRDMAVGIFLGSFQEKKDEPEKANSYEASTQFTEGRFHAPETSPRERGHLDVL